MPFAAAEPQTEASAPPQAARPVSPPTAPESLRVAGNDLTVFVETPDLFGAMLKDIQAATNRVWMETYIFHHDTGASSIADALMEKAKQGLDVRLHYDAIGSAATPTAFFARMQAAGVKLHAFHSVLEGVRRFDLLAILNRRNHRKLLVIDDTVGYFGGMNIIDNAPANTPPGTPNPDAAKLPASAGWRDVHIRLQGPAQAELAESFNRSWCRAKGEKVPRKPRRLVKAQLRSACRLNGGHSQESIHFFDSGGVQNRASRAARIYTRLIRGARRQITLSMAYFIPVGAPLRALLAARKRQVRVQVVVPGISDVKIVQRATTYLYSQLIKRGFRIYERRGRMLHSKMMVIDGLYSVVGSANFDPRSLRINMEFVSVIRSEELAGILQRVARFEMTQSDRITLRHVRHISWFDRVLNRFAWMFRWWL